MSVPELEDEIRSALDDNPALEARTDSEAATTDDFGESAHDLQMADYADADDVPAYMHNRRQTAGDPSFDPTTIAPDDGDSMIEALMRRLENDYDLSDSDRRIAENIIGNLDGNGYLTRRLADISDDISVAEGFEPAPGQVRRIFEAIRSLDPAGICAVDLRDCLLLQLDRLEPTPARRMAREIVADHFDLFAKKHFDRLGAMLDTDRSHLAEALDEIKALNPKPASMLDFARTSDRSRHISPDIALDYDPASDTFTVSLLGNIPELTIEESFSSTDDTDYADRTESADDSAAKKRQRQALAFIRRKRDDAAAFIKLVEMRGSTLLNIAKAIVKLQHDFFAGGDKADIKPMILKDVSALTGLDLSVISRATANKYILTFHGIYPLKMFFNERPDADADVSTHEILEKLSAIIEAENKHSPLSDQALCEALQKQGYDIARRTVAKYRERLGKPVARLRKQL